MFRGSTPSQWEGDINRTQCFPKSFRVHEGKVGRVDYELEVSSLVLDRAVDIDVNRS